MTNVGAANDVLIDLGPESSPSSAATSPWRKVHLLVLIHGASWVCASLRLRLIFTEGMWGSCEHLRELASRGQSSPLSPNVIYSTDLSSRYTNEFKTYNVVVAESQSSPSRATVSAAW